MDSMDEPLVWHFGLMAERWAEFNTDAPEAPYLLAVISRFGQPVLDLACGTGRLLLPVLRAGIDIDGCDLSADMLHHCDKRAAVDGFHPRLFQQPMHSFELGRTYKTIYLCGSLGLAGSRANDLRTLQRCYSHLQIGGALLLNIQAEYTSRDFWHLWLSEHRKALPQPWPDKGTGKVASDGHTHYAQFRMLDLDPLEQTYTRQVRLEKWSSSELVTREEYTLKGNIYFRNELLLMLSIAGFGEVTVHGDYRNEPATAEHRELVFEEIRTR